MLKKLFRVVGLAFLISLLDGCSQSSNIYLMTFNNYDNSYLFSEKFFEGAAVSYHGPTPTKPSENGITYTFNGWDKDLGVAKADTTFVAQYKVSGNLKTCACTFLNYDNSVLYTTDVISGGTAIYKGETPTKPNSGTDVFTFVGWDKPLENITVDTTFIAQYEANVTTYTCNFYNYNNILLYTTKVKEGNDVLYGGETPLKEKDAQYTYTFKGWDQALTNIKKDTDFIAQYDSKLNQYRVAFINYDTTVLQAGLIDYGTYAKYTGAVPTKPNDGTNSFTFKGWDRDPATTLIQSDMIFTAQYTSSAIKTGKESVVVAPTTTNMGYTLTTDYDKNTVTKSDFTYIALSDSSTYGWDYINSFTNSALKNKYTYIYCSIWETAVAFKSKTGTLSTMNVGGTDYYVFGKFNLAEAYTSLTDSDWNDVMSIVELFRVDNPKFYSLDATFAQGSNYGVLVIDEEYASRTYRDTIDASIEEYLTSSTTLLASLSTEETKARALYDNLINKVSYAYKSGSTSVPESAQYAHSVAGVVKQNKVVCEGYALMYELLCLRNNIDCVVGLGLADVNDSGSGHAWNYLKLGTTWYCVDATWGDQVSQEDFYFKQPYATFKNRHNLGYSLSIFYPVPSPIY